MRSRTEDKTDLITSFMPKNEKTDELMKLMKVMKTNNQTTSRPVGLKPVRNIAPDDILGALLKYFGRSS